MILSTQAAAALARIARVSGVRAEPQTLMPAEVILELSGEAVRSRLCTFTDASGREYCLRPDLTTPIAQMVASDELPIARYHGSGPVYRLPPRGVQVGQPLIGDAADLVGIGVIRVGGDRLARIGDLLVSAGDLAILAPQEAPAGAEIDLLVTATNRIPAHNLPTGSTFLRQMWLDVTVTDAPGWGVQIAPAWLEKATRQVSELS